MLSENENNPALRKDLSSSHYNQTFRCYGVTSQKSACNRLKSLCNTVIPGRFSHGCYGVTKIYQWVTRQEMACNTCNTEFG